MVFDRNLPHCSIVYNLTQCLLATWGHCSLADSPARGNSIVAGAAWPKTKYGRFHDPWRECRVLSLRAGVEISVAFRSAKDAAFAERKATMRHLLICPSQKTFGRNERKPRKKRGTRTTFFRTIKKELTSCTIERYFPHPAKCVLCLSTDFVMYAWIACRVPEDLTVGHAKRFPMVLATQREPQPSLAEVCRRIDGISALLHIALRVMEVASDPNSLRPRRTGRERRQGLEVPLGGDRRRPLSSRLSRLPGKPRADSAMRGSRHFSLLPRGPEAR